MRDSTVVGTLATMYAEWPESDRDAMLDLQVQAVHITPMAFACTISPRTRVPTISTARGCSDFARLKGDQQTRIHLVEIRRKNEAALASAHTNPALAPSWIKHCEDTIAGVTKILAMDDDQDTPNGTYMRPFADGQSRFERLED